MIDPQDVQRLIEQWRAEAEKDYHARYDDVEDGVWAHQHEAAGRCRKGRQCADALSALLASLPHETPQEKA